MYNKIILICGMPRSGTSWVGQIFDSSPDVAFRMEPLFAYRFKNIIDQYSSKENIVAFFNNVFFSDDDFINQQDNRKKGAYYSFEKNPNQEFLVIKTTRHHHLLERYLELIDCIEVISIVRHPCAVISSWINTEREFSAKGCTIESDWRNGACRKDDIGEYWGFDDWLSVTKLHVELSQKYSNFNIVKYSDLVKDTHNVVSELFTRCSLQYTSQTHNFLKDCHGSHQDDPYSVFKTKDVENQWKAKLDSSIAREIVVKTIDSGLEAFMS